MLRCKQYDPAEKPPSYLKIELDNKKSSIIEKPRPILMRIE